MNTVDILLYSIISVGLLVVIGWILSLIAIGRAARTQKELKQIYGQESEIKKRIEQYISKKASDELGKAVEGYKEGLDLQSREVVKQMEEATKIHMDSLAKFILQQEALITKQAEYIVGAIVKNAQSDIEIYKKNQLEGIDEAVAGIVEKVAPEVIGKSISMEDHAELVWKALERAKKEGLFVKGVNAGPAVRGPVTTFLSASARLDKIEPKTDSEGKLRASGDLSSRATPRKESATPSDKSATRKKGTTSTRGTKGTKKKGRTGK